MQNLDDRGQGAFEYILLLAGVMLVAVLVIVVLKNTVLPSANDQLNKSVGTWKKLVNINCTSEGACSNV